MGFVKKYSKVFWLCLLEISMLLIGIVLVFQEVHIPYKLDMDYDTSIIIEDNAKVLSEVERNQLAHTFGRFRESTGITPMLIILSNNEFIQYGKSVENIAQELYATRINDEKHCLLVYLGNGRRDIGSWAIIKGKKCFTLNALILNKMEKILITDMLSLDWYSRESMSLGKVFNDTFDTVIPSLSMFFVHRSFWFSVIVLYLFFSLITFNIVKESLYIQGFDFILKPYTD